MHAAVDYQADATEDCIVKLSEMAPRIVGVHADLHSELLSIECPAFCIGIEARKLADQRQVRLLLNRALKMVAGNRFMEGECGQGPARRLGGVPQIDIIAARP